MSGLPAAIFIIIIAMCIYWESFRHFEPYNKALNNTYDYIIVGAGSSGAVIAARLSEDPAVRVLLIEAGGQQEDNPSIAVPGLRSELDKSNIDWFYLTEPQKHACRAMHENRSYCPRGKVLGGSSSLNYMVYVRGSRHDYDSWAAEGCDGWSYKDVLPYFKKSEKIAIDDFKEYKYRGKSGPLVVTSPRGTPMEELYIKAAQELGYDITDPNGENQIGISRMQATIKNGLRWDTNQAFLKPNHGRSNLDISINTLAKKVVIENGKAIGVDIIKNGRKRRIFVNYEVILSCGAINSPQLLMLSGIGPEKHLQQLGIEVKADLPVGEGLQDHLEVPVLHNLNTSGYVRNFGPPSVWTKMEYNLFGTGPLSSTAAEGLLFTYKENDIKKDAERAPDIQFHFLSMNLFAPDLKDAVEFNYAEDVKQKIFTSDTNRDAMCFKPVLLHPKSRGTVRLRSTDPFDPPLINPHYLEHPDDVKTLIHAMRITENLIETKTLKSIGMSMDNPSPLYSLCSEHRFRSDAFWECFIRHFASTLYHVSCTCRMGAVDDPTAVVDPQLRVKGIRGLRVADASVMRNVPSGNTNAPCIMIGEKAADLIKNTRNHR